MSIEQQEWTTHLPISLVILDENLDVVDASRAAFSMFHVHFSASDKKGSLSALSEKLSSNKSFASSVGVATFELTLVGSRDQLRWQDEDRVFDINISALPPEDHLNYALHFEDVSKKIKLERSQELTRNYLEQMIDSLPLGIIVTDCDMKITTMNKMQRDFMLIRGINTSLLNSIGSPLFELIPEHEEFTWQEVDRKLFVDRVPITGIQYACGENEIERTFSVNIIPLRKESGEVIGAMHVTEEITKTLNLQAEAREAEVLAGSLETLQQTVVTLNHVINNKLMGIMCSIEVVRSTGAPLEENKLRVLEDILDEGEKIAQFIRDLANIKEIKVVDYLKGGEKMLDVSAE